MLEAKGLKHIIEFKLTILILKGLIKLLLHMLTTNNANFNHIHLTDLYIKGSL